MFVHKYARPSSLSLGSNSYIILSLSQSSIFNNPPKRTKQYISFDSWIKANKNNQQS